MCISRRKINLIIGAIFVLSLIVGLINVPKSYADESTQEATVPSYAMLGSSEEHAFPHFDYQGKANLKEYWDAVQSYRSEIFGMKESFENLDPTDEQWEQVDALINAARKETDLNKLESMQAEVTDLLDEWTKGALAAAGVDASALMQGYSAQGTGTSYYAAAIQSGVLTRAGGVNSFFGRTETWYSQKVLPGGGLSIPGRHVAEDGTVRDADNYIVVAASDLSYGAIVDTSLGAGKVYDTGCAPGITDVYTDW